MANQPVQYGQLGKITADTTVTPEDVDKAKWCVLSKAPLDAVETILAALGIPDLSLAELI